MSHNPRHGLEEIVGALWRWRRGRGTEKEGKRERERESEVRGFVIVQVPLSDQRGEASNTEWKSHRVSSDRGVGERNCIRRASRSYLSLH